MRNRAMSCVIGVIVALSAGGGRSGQAADAAGLSPEPQAAAKAAVESKPAKEKRIAERYKAFGGEKAAFRCSVPADWGQTRDEHDDERTHTFGVLLSGPAGADGVSPTVSLRFYGPGNPTADDAGAFLKRQLQPSLVKPRGEETSNVSDAVVAGLKARTFTRTTSEFVPPDSLDSKAVQVRQQVFVIPDPKGYFVLRFSASSASFDKWKLVFQTVRDSFKPTR